MEDDHRHCRVCGKMSPPDQEYCSKKCRQQRETTQRTRRQYIYILYALIGITILLTLINYHII